MMKVVRLKKVRWSVLALCDEHDRCYVLDFLDGLEKRYASAGERLKYWLFEELPLNGPPSVSTPQCKHLRDKIYELKQGPRLRILWFYHPDPAERNTIICTEGVFKDQRKTNSDAIDRAVQYRAQFESTHKAGNIILVSLKGT